jgi:hypothetical protein
MMLTAFQKATEHCEREDCSLSATHVASTCLTWTPTYNKQGERTDKGDPNTYTNTIECSTCNRKWEAATLYNETTIKEIPKEDQKSESEPKAQEA